MSAGKLKESVDVLYEHQLNRVDTLSYRCKCGQSCDSSEDFAFHQALALVGAGVFRPEPVISTGDGGSGDIRITSIPATLDTVKVGDEIDPGTPGLTMGADTSCGHRFNGGERQGANRWWCNRVKGHGGQHVAIAGRKVVGVIAHENDDPLAHIKVGDPDPTKEIGYEKRCEGHIPPHWVCTREKNHPGQHIGGDSVTVKGVGPSKGAVDLDTAKVGDVDPTDHSTGNWCELEWYGEHSTLWQCTREPGHSGQHIAGDEDKVCAVLPKDGDPWANVKVGWTDMTPDDTYEDEDGDQADTDYCHEPIGDGSTLCTRLPHPTHWKHIAGNGSTIIAVEE